MDPQRLTPAFIQGAVGVWVASRTPQAFSAPQILENGVFILLKCVAVGGDQAFPRGSASLDRHMALVWRVFGLRGSLAPRIWSPLEKKATPKLDVWLSGTNPQEIRGSAIGRAGMDAPQPHLRPPAAGNFLWYVTVTPRRGLAALGKTCILANCQATSRG